MEASAAFPAPPAPLPAGEPFAGSLAHLLAELGRIDLLIRVQVARARRLHEADPEFQGLYVSEQEIDDLLARPAGMPGWAVEPPRPEVLAALEAMSRGIAARTVASVRQGVELRLLWLARLFNLSPFEVDVLLVAFAPELDLRYERLFAYLQDDVTKRRPSVDLVLNLLARDFAEKLAARSRFAASASLLQHRLIELFDDAARPHPPLLARYLKADPRVVAYLLGEDGLDPRLQPFARAVDTAPRVDEAIQPAGVAERLLACARSADNRLTVFYLQGPYGVGKETTARALCRTLGLALLAVDLARLLAAEEGVFETGLALAEREAALSGAALYWQGFDLLLEGERAARRTQFLARLAAHRGLVFLAGEAEWEPAEVLRTAVFLRVPFPLPEHRERVALWAEALGVPAAEGMEEADGLDLAALAAKFRLSGGQIKDAAATAKNLAHGRGEGRPTLADLHTACRLQSNRKLSALAQKIVPRYRFADIVLPTDRMEQLQEICNFVRYGSRVYEEWGFGRRLSLGKGLSALFAGPSGTGKTMAAEIIAFELGLDLYKIDLSTVVSKYIGETEKNLSRVFTEAEASNAVLFFDEADALFGKRSEVKDAHDRYANIETGYLLQRMEEYQGVVILATNLKKNMDAAFLRRLRFVLEFPFPDESDRRRIWERLWPAETPLAPELDFALLARRFELPGGNIRNIALAAAFLAAADGGTVTLRHLLRATQREFQKIGKVLAVGELNALAAHQA
ncbi:MAG TPA: AAA family ATPase [Thermoanaerobaculia bacterium]|nr:AAA family ATPase [Thermoanaerobaculia bacterium]